MLKRQAFPTRFIFPIFIISLSVLLTTCRRESPKQTKLGKRGFVKSSGTSFVDAAGAVVVFHGVNVVNKSKKESYLGGVDSQMMAQIRNWGMNCIRLGIFWDAIEPKPGEINQDYLARVAQAVGWAKAEGIHVLLDMPRIKGIQPRPLLPMLMTLWWIPTTRI
jgi:endoglycosylceramidase